MKNNIKSWKTSLIGVILLAFAGSMLYFNKIDTIEFTVIGGAGIGLILGLNDNIFNIFKRS